MLEIMMKINKHFYSMCQCEPSFNKKFHHLIKENFFSLIVPVYTTPTTNITHSTLIELKNIQHSTLIIKEYRTLKNIEHSTLIELKNMKLCRETIIKYMELNYYAVYQSP